MQAYLPIRVIVLGFGLALISTGLGCRSGLSGSESLWKRPNFSGLAFWKKDEATVPKPPAVHFDPTPAQAESQVATRNSPKDIKSSLDKLAKYESKPESAPEGEVKSEASATNSKPLRTPYQMSSSSSGTGSTSKVATTPGTSGNTAIGGAALKGLAQNGGATSSSLTGQKPSASNPKNASDFLPGSAAPLNIPDSGGRLASTDDQARAQFNADMQGLKVPTPSISKPASVMSEQVAGAKQALSSEQQRLEAEVARSQKEIADLKAQLAANSARLAPIAGSDRVAANPLSFQPAPKSTQSVNAVASANPGSLNASSNNAGFAPLRPNSNVTTELQARPGSMPDSSTRLAPMANPYPATSHGGFSTINDSDLTTTRPDNQIRPVGLQAQISPAADGSGGEANANVDDIDIPEAILKGSGNYSPGSVNRLRGN